MNQKMKRSRQILVALVLTAAVIGISSCEKYTWTPEVINPIDTVYFQTEIQPIFTAKCATCHGAIRDPDLRDGESYTSLTDGNFVDLPAESSTLYSVMIGSSHASKSSDLDKQKVLQWINQGALNN